MGTVAGEGPVAGCAEGAAGLFVLEGAEAGVEDFEYLEEGLEL